VELGLWRMELKNLLVFLQTVYDTWFITCYNLIYTSLPVLGMSLFDQVRSRSKPLRVEAPGLRQ
jgi:magnesium-transporting ATPase (P-type)